MSSRKKILRKVIQFSYLDKYVKYLHTLYVREEKYSAQLCSIK